jgi:hypothetical protein
VCGAAADLQRTPFVVVATPLQALALRRRLAAGGMHAFTSENLCAADVYVAVARAGATLTVTGWGTPSSSARDLM